MQTFRKLISNFNDENFNISDYNCTLISKEIDFNVVLVLFRENHHSLEPFHQGLLIKLNDKTIFYDDSGVKEVYITLLEIHRGNWSKLIECDDWINKGNAKMITFNDIEELTKDEFIETIYNNEQSLLHL